MKNKVPKGYWLIKENCIADAKKYKSKTEWCKNSKVAYNSALKNGWLDECCAHMIIKMKNKVPKGYWDIKENCIAKAKKYKSKTEWRKECPSSYNAALKNGWMDECSKHMVAPFKPKGYWLIKENCIADAKKYKSRTEWGKNSSIAYKSACKNGWVDECCAHMERKGTRFKRMIYIYTFPDNHIYIGLTCDEKRRKNEHFSHNEKKCSPVYNYMMKTNQIPKYEILSDYINKDDASILENFYIEQYKNNGYILLNRKKGGGLGGNTKKYTKEYCIADAKKYTTYSKWCKESPNVYEAARKNGYLDECCVHMPSRKIKKPNGYWDIKENCIEDSKNYTTKTEWSKKSPLAWASANKNGWMRFCFPPKKAIDHYSIAA